MSSSINIYPFDSTEGLVRFGIQVAIFIIGLYASHKLIIKPALRLHAERKRRTEGNSNDAKKDIEKANNLEHEYFSRLKEGADIARQLRLQEISEARQLAITIIADTQQKSNDYLKNIRDQLARETMEARAKLFPLLDDVVNIVYKKLGITAIIFIIGLLFSVPTLTAYGAAEKPLISSFWYGVFWPYFQFSIFILAVIYFARKPLRSLLEKRRDDFRAKLSEAREAVYLANKKVKDYEAMIASLTWELNLLKERNLADAKLETERIIKEANDASRAILRDAERAAKEFINSGKEEIKKELFSLALNEVEKRLTEDKLSILDQKYKQDILENIKRIH